MTSIRERRPMENLKRSRSGDWILRYWTNGRGSRLAYHNLGRLTHTEAKDRARVLMAESEASKTLADPNITFKRLPETEVPLDRISGILGRKDPKMVLRYAHIQPEDLDGALGAVERAAGFPVNER